MRIIKPGFEIMTPIDGQNILEHLEQCGRVCYKSEGKITDGSAEKFVANIVKRGHEAVLEHASFAFILPYGEWRGLQKIIQNLECHDFKCFLRFTDDGRGVVSGNVRAWRDFMKACYEQTEHLPLYMKKFIERNPILFPEFQSGIRFIGSGLVQMIPVTVDDLKTENEFLTHCDVTVRWVVDRGISHEIVRHRLASYCQESTRYCNYSKDSFGSEITVIEPLFLAEGAPGWTLWKHSCEVAEKYYFELLNWGCTPQEARAVLPTSLKTEVVMTANIREWRHFLRLRTSSAAHPQIREVAVPLLHELQRRLPVLFDDIKEG